MTISWTKVQKQRLKELNAAPDLLEKLFSSTRERDKTFQEEEKRLIEQGKAKWQELRDVWRRPSLCRLETKLVDVLTANGFVQVVTPIMMAKGLLEKMGITPEHPLWNQVYWVEENKCLRPMLAPHLYYILKDLLRLWPKPVRIFEVGPCFRKETRGAQHLSEFTMLNLVEMGLPKEGRHERLKELATMVMEAAGIRGYQLVSTESEVYGDTIDVVAGIEMGSGAMGPHYLDAIWGINDPWVGIGFGLERLAMVKEGYQNIKRAGRSLVYLDGVRLNI